MATISTHILDTALGRPAGGIDVKLERESDGWQRIGDGLTNEDGRVAQLVEPAYQPLVVGRYRITFEIEKYMANVGHEEYFYPFVQFVFDLKNADEHYHVPLLLSPFGISTYRRS